MITLYSGTPGAVAPFAGAWIEIMLSEGIALGFMVAPFAGAWIEIVNESLIGKEVKRRSLRGSVD